MDEPAHTHKHRHVLAGRMPTGIQLTCFNTCTVVMAAAASATHTPIEAISRFPLPPVLLHSSACFLCLSPLTLLIITFVLTHPPRFRISPLISYLPPPTPNLPSIQLPQHTPPSPSIPPSLFPLSLLPVLLLQGAGFADSDIIHLLKIYE